MTSLAPVVGNSPAKRLSRAGAYVGRLRVLKAGDHETEHKSVAEGRGEVRGGKDYYIFWYLGALLD